MSNKIYIKIEPLTEKITKDETKQFLRSGIIPASELAKLNYFLTAIGKDFDSFLDDIYSRDEENWFSRSNYEGCENFWTYKETENGIMMIEHPLNKEGIKREFKTLEDSEKEFISLSSFLENGTYIGKYFRRTVKMFDADTEYLPVNHSIFALYELNGAILTIKQKNEQPVFEIIPKTYTMDKNFEYYGSKKENLDDKKLINSEIVKQLKKVL